MRSPKSRLALSPLVTTAILITAGILGGLLLYQYFSNVMTAISSTEAVSLELTVQSIGTTTRFYYRIENVGTSPIVLKNITVLDSAGEVVHVIDLGGVVLYPGDTLRDVSINATTLSDVKYGILTYVVNGEEIEAPAVRVIWR